MIWLLENEKYRVELPTMDMVKTLPQIEQEQEILVHTATATGNYFYTVIIDQENQEVVRTGLVLNYDKGNAPDKLTLASKWEYHIHPVLVPLDKDGNPINKRLLAEIPDGTVVKIGHLNHAGTSMYPYLNPLDIQYSIDEDNVGNPLTWVACDGCLISKTPLFKDSPQRAWEVFYN